MHIKLLGRDELRLNDNILSLAACFYSATLRVCFEETVRSTNKGISNQYLEQCACVHRHTYKKVYFGMNRGAQRILAHITVQFRTRAVKICNFDAVE